MKRNKATLAVLLAALSFFAAPSASAISQSDVVAIRKTVANVPAAELAAKAAQIVAQASNADRQEVALATVREIVSKRPATLVAAVAAIAKTSPEVTVAVVTEAARLANDQAPEIAKAAASSAPAQSDRIAAAVAKAAPKSATQVTRAVATVVPTQTSRIVERVVASVPSARAEIASDSVITRLTQRSAATTGNTGIITTRPGTIAGTPAPDVPPTSVSGPVIGSDPRRSYASPGQ
jgi:hypothetical protein